LNLAEDFYRLQTPAPVLRASFFEP